MNNTNKDSIKKKGKKSSIHTTISNQADQILEKYANKNNENSLFESKSKVIEKALELLDEYYHPEKADLQTIWNRARKDLNMILVGKRTFLSYISGDYQKALKENIAIDVLEWFKSKHIDEMSLIELLEAIKNIWLAANYFYKIDIEVKSKKIYQMSFYHDFHSDRYSDYWGNYFKELLSKFKGCKVDVFGRNESLILKITFPN